MKRPGNVLVIPAVRIVYGDRKLDLSSPGIGGAPLGSVGIVDGGSDDERVVDGGLPLGKEVGLQALGREVEVLADEAGER